MPKLSDLRNAKEVLPGKKKALDYDEDWHNRTGGFLPNNDKKEEKGFNKAIDAYNNVRIEGDVEVLMKCLWSLELNSGTWEDADGWEKEVFRNRANLLLESMPTWVVVRKGEYERD